MLAKQIQIIECVAKVLVIVNKISNQSIRCCVLMLCCVFSLVSCRTPSTEKASVKPRTVAVETITVDYSQIVDKTQTIGTLSAFDSVDITSKVSERITKLHFQDNQWVDKGTVLVSLSGAEQQALLKEAEADYQEADIHLQRLTRLASGLTAQSEIDQAKAQLQALSGRLEAIQARIDERSIVAPFSGHLGFRRVSEGALISPGEVITSLDATQQLNLDFNVADLYFSYLQQGSAVTATTPAWPDRQFKGTVTSVGSRIDPVTRAVVVRASFENIDNSLRPGMLMNVELQLDLRKAMVVPEQTLIQQDRNSFVYIIDDAGKAQRKSVVIGKRMPGSVEIVSGLEVGDHVVSKGQFNLRPGVAVEVQTSVANAP